MGKEKNVVKSSLAISAIVLIGKALGFVKQAVIAWAFGASATTDIYFAADGYTSMFGQIMGQSVGPAVLTRKEIRSRQNNLLSNAFSSLGLSVLYSLPSIFCCRQVYVI